jgi:hypothetical protein
VERRQQWIENMASWQHGPVLPNYSDGIATMAGDSPCHPINKVWGQKQAYNYQQFKAPIITPPGPLTALWSESAVAIIQLRIKEKNSQGPSPQIVRSCPVG